MSAQPAVVKISGKEHAAPIARRSDEVFMVDFTCLGG
jgi:hypothetical protein